MPYKDPKKRREAFRKYYEKNKEKVLDKNKKWRKENPDKVAVINERYHLKQTGELEVTMHETIEDALDSLLREPEPKIELDLEPEPMPISETEEEKEEKIDKILNNLKVDLTDI